MSSIQIEEKCPANVPSEKLCLESLIRKIAAAPAEEADSSSSSDYSPKFVRISEVSLDMIDSLFPSFHNKLGLYNWNEI